MNPFKIVLVFVLGATVGCAQVSSAYQTADRSLVDIARSAAAAVRGRIVEGAEVNVVEDDGSRISCGFDFILQVTDVIDGPLSRERRVRFRSFDQLRIGGDYLILLSSADLGGEASFTTMGRKRFDLLTRCQETATGYFASSLHGELFEFDMFLFASTGADWLRLIGGGLVIPTGVETREVTVSGSSDPIYELLRWADLYPKLKRALPNAE